MADELRIGLAELLCKVQMEHDANFLKGLSTSPVHHRGWAKLIHKLLPRNVCRNALEVVVL